MDNSSHSNQMHNSSHPPLSLRPLWIIALFICSTFSFAFWCSSPAHARQVSVYSYGATGDGIHDDSEAIQSAINAVNYDPANSVLFPHGTYLIGHKHPRLAITSITLKGITSAGNAVLNFADPDSGIGVNGQNAQLYDL